MLCILIVFRVLIFFAFNFVVFALPCYSALLCCLVHHHALLQGYLPSLPCCSRLVTLSLIVAPCYFQCHTLLLSDRILLLCLATLPLCLVLVPYYFALLFVTPCCLPFCSVPPATPPLLFHYFEVCLHTLLFYFVS